MAEYQVLSLDGVDSYVELGTPQDLLLSSNHPFTWEGWLYFKAFSDRDMLACKNNGRDNDPYDYLLGIRDSNTYMSAYDGASWHDILYSVNINEWVHLAFAFDGNTIRFYVNGVKIGETSYSWTQDASNNLKIGGYAPEKGINGYYSDVRFWSTSRTEEQINYYKSYRIIGDEAGLLAYYILDEGSGTTATDSAGSNDGVLVNGAWSLQEMPLDPTLISMEGEGGGVFGGYSEVSLACGPQDYAAIGDGGIVFGGSGRILVYCDDTLPPDPVKLKGALLYLHDTVYGKLFEPLTPYRIYDDIPSGIDESYSVPWRQDLGITQPVSFYLVGDRTKNIPVYSWHREDLIGANTYNGTWIWEDCMTLIMRHI